MSTIVFSNQSSIFFTIFSVNSKPQPYQKSSDVLHGENQDHPLGQTPQQTQKFIQDVQEALEAFEDQVGSLTEEIRSNAYKNFLEAYHDTLTPVWNLACFTNIETILATITNPQMTELTMMAQHLKCEEWQQDAPTYYLLFRMYSGFGSTSHLLLGLCRQVRIFIQWCF